MPLLAKLTALRKNGAGECRFPKSHGDTLNLFGNFSFLTGYLEM